MRRRSRLSIFLVVLALFGMAVVASPVVAAIVTVINNDGPGEGFNDPTPTAPVGGNTGTTIGAQRLIAFQRAADIWGGLLSSAVTIRVRATFDPLFCQNNSAVLGSAGPISVFRDFPGAPVMNTWYAVALANALRGSDNSAGADIVAQFNGSIGTTCPFPRVWYYGLDGNAGNNIDFVTVAVHEIGHGLGFLTFVDTATGAKMAGLNDAFMLNLEDHGASPPDYPSMTDAQRVAAAIDTGNLHWVGAHVRAASGVLTAGTVGDHVRMFAPTIQQPGSSVSHWDTALTPNQLMEPSYTVPLDPMLELPLFQDIGWTLLAFPVISVTPSSQDFGTVAVGSFADRNFAVQNIGGGTLVGAASTSAPFSIISADSYSLGTGASQIVTVRFTPTSATTVSGNVTFTGGGGATRVVTAGSPAFSYTLANSGAIAVTRGASGATTITATLQTGTTQAVSFAASGLPSGTTAAFTPGLCSPTCSSTLTLTTTGATPLGTFPITVTGSPLNVTTTFNLTVSLASSFAYTLTNSGNIPVTRGASGATTITATLQTGTTQAVSFGASGVPSGTSAAFIPGPCSPTCSTTLTIATTGATPLGTFPITVTGSPLNVSTTFNLTVNPVGFTYTLTNSGNITVARGTSGTTTITATLQTGSTTPVSFAVGGLPGGTTAAFTPGTCSPTCSSTLTITATGIALLGTFPITVTGSPLNVTTTFNLVVSPSATLSLSASVNQPTFTVGQTLSATIGLTNPGLPKVAEVYLGTLRPDGSIEFFTSTGLVVGGLADLRPIVTDLSLVTPFSVTVPNVSSHLFTGSDPHGSYTFFFAITSAGDLLGVATASYSFP